MEPIQKTLAKQLKPIPAAKDLGFGQHFTDHWFQANFIADRGWSNLRIEPYANICLDPAASVFHYGQALFEGMKVFRRPDGSLWLFRPDFNHQRMVDGADRLCLQAPPREIFMSGLRELIAADARWVPPEDNCSLYIRPTLIGTEPFLGVRPSREILFYIILSPVGSYYTEGSSFVKIWVESKAMRAAPGGLGAVKAGANYAASLKTALEAKSKGYSQVLWLDVEHDGIEEVGTMNVFFVFKNNEVVTPALNGSILGGGVRDSVIQLLRRQGLQVTERRVTMTEILKRQQNGELLEAFGTGTAAVITPIGEFNFQGQAHSIGNSGVGALTRETLQTVTAIQRGRKPDEFGWMVPLESVR